MFLRPFFPYFLRTVDFDLFVSFMEISVLDRFALCALLFGNNADNFLTPLFSSNRINCYERRVSCEEMQAKVMIKRVARTWKQILSLQLDSIRMARTTSKSCKVWNHHQICPGSFFRHCFLFSVAFYHDADHDQYTKSSTFPVCHSATHMR